MKLSNSTCNTADVSRNVFIAVVSRKIFLAVEWLLARAVAMPRIDENASLLRINPTAHNTRHVRQAF